MTKTRADQPLALDPPPERCCISWTGGKDCNLALLTCWEDPSLEVTDLVVFRPESRADFEAHPMALMRAQADSLGLDLRTMVLPASSSYRDAYVDAIRQLRDDVGIQVIATGDMDLVDIENSSDNYIKECCELLPGGGVRTYLPLWEADREDCLRRLVVTHGCEIVFSCVKSPWFDASWCGRRLDEAALLEMKAIREGRCDRVSFAEEEMSEWGAKDPRRTPLDLGGENGEYHSMVLGGPLYQYGIVLKAAKATVDDDDDDDENQGGNDGGDATNRNVNANAQPPISLRAVVTGPAEDGNDRWWTYTGQTRWSLGAFEIERKPKPTVDETDH